MTIVTRHRGAQDSTLFFRHEQELGLESEFLRDCDLGPIPQRISRKHFLPQGFHAWKIVFAIPSHDHYTCPT
jgi:hypothetical protein